MVASESVALDLPMGFTFIRDVALVMKHLLHRGGGNSFTSNVQKNPIKLTL